MKKTFLTRIIARSTLKRTRKRSGNKNSLSIQTDPVLVYQMGKVGSKTIEKSIKENYAIAGIEVPVFHVHFLNDFEMWRQKALQERVDPTPTLLAMEHGEMLRHQIDSRPLQNWNIVTLIRDPVARNVATLFQNLADFIPDWREYGSYDTKILDKLLEILLRNDSISTIPEYWFDAQVRDVPAFRIDVYESAFPKDIGYKIYPGTVQASLLLLRLENINDCIERAMREFLGIEKFKLYSTNVGEEKEYSSLYQSFKKKPLPLSYVQKVYNTKFARHFYTDAELDTFTKRWTQMDKQN